MTPTRSWRTRARNEVEVALGGVQMRAMERALVVVARLHADRTDEGVAFYTRAAKTGLPFVGVHGFGGDKETWLMMAAWMARSRGLALIDLPGHGRSAEVQEREAAIRNHAEAVVRVLDRLGIERAVICGNSMGGGVALRLATSWPDRVAGIVLVASIGRDIHDGGAHSWIDGHNPLIPGEDDIETFMQLVLERPLAVPKSVIRYVVTQRTRRAPLLRRLYRGFVVAGGDAGVPRDLAGVTCPALVVHGEQDRIIDKRTAIDLAEALPRAELVVMRGVGHAPQLEAPRHTAKLVEAFIARVEEDRRRPARRHGVG